METLTLNAEIRSGDEKLKDIRASKLIPAVVYGHSKENISLKLDYSEFLKTFRKSGESHIVNLVVSGKEMDVLVRKVQKEPVSGNFIHIDFYAITKGETVHTKIHLKLVGASDAVKEGAILEEHIKEIELKCLPKDLVDDFSVDLSKLKEIGDTIRVSDLGIDTTKYNILTSLNEMIVSATRPAKIEEAPKVEETK